MFKNRVIQKFLYICTNKLLAIGRNSRFRDLQTCIKNELICKGLNEMVSIEKADIPDFIRKEKGLPPKTINTIGITIDMSFL